MTGGATQVPEGTEAPMLGDPRASLFTPRLIDTCTRKFTNRLQTDCHLDIVSCVNSYSIVVALGWVKSGDRQHVVRIREQD